MTVDETPAYRARLDQLVQQGPSDPIGQLLGWRGIRWDEGSFDLAWEAENTFIHGGGIIHGGMLTTLLDTAMGLAVATVMQQGEATATADLHVQFLRAARPGRLTVRGTLLRRTRQLAFCAGQVQDAEGVELVHGVGTFAIVQAR